MKRIIIIAFSLAFIIVIFYSLSKFNTNVSDQIITDEQEKYQIDGSNYKIGMITDTGGINDQSFNQGAWEGLKHLKKRTGATTSYIQSRQASDFVTNLELLIDNGNTLCWGIGYACADSVLEVAQNYNSINFGIVDNEYSVVPQNVTCVVFRGQEPSFLAGYLAASLSKSRKVGFVGGVSGDIIDQFHYGYVAGVDYSNLLHNTDVAVMVQYAESFSDAAKGKAIANKMYAQGCDIVFHAAGGTGVGVIESAKENGKYVIGADRDQSYLAPDNVLTSVLKNVNVVIEDISIQYILGEPIGGQVFEYGLEQGAMGLTMNSSLLTDALKEDVSNVKEDIVCGNIVPPKNKREYDMFLARTVKRK